MDKEWYSNEYWIKERSLGEIGKELGVCAQTVLNRMKKMGIPRRTGAKHTTKTKRLLSKIQAGPNNYWYGKKRSRHAKHMKQTMKGRVFSKEAKQKMSTAKKGICGSKHNRWVDPDKRKGTLNKNIRRLKKMEQWRKAVFSRDDFTCQQCGERGGYLHADHIKPLHFLIKMCRITKPSEAIAEPKLWEVSNGRSLCVRCHKETKTYGSKIRKLNVSLEQE